MTKKKKDEEEEKIIENSMCVYCLQRHFHKIFIALLLFFKHLKKDKIH